MISLVLVACGGSRSSALDRVPAEFRPLAAKATGFQQQALTDGIISRQEVEQGMQNAVTCLKNLGYQAGGDLNGISVTGVSERDARASAAVDRCMEAEANLLSSIYDVQQHGTAQQQTAKIVDCMIRHGALGSAATPQDLDVYEQAHKTDDNSPLPQCIAELHGG